MRRIDREVVVGLFLLVGILALGWISVRLGQVEILGASGYTVYAEFTTVGGLKEGAGVEIAGVRIGRVEGISLGDDYQARVRMRIDSGIKLQEDTIASIKTKGLIGERYMHLSPGAADEIISSGGEIRETEPPVDLEELIGTMVFGKF